MVTSGVAKQNNLRDIFEHFLQSLPDGFAVATSGGISSAALLASAVAVNKKPKVVSFTFNDFFSKDFIHAEAMAHYFKVPFHAVFLPSDKNKIINSVSTLIHTYKLKKKARIECSFPFLYVAETCKSLGITELVTGLCDDGHFGLSKKAMIHYKHTQEKFSKVFLKFIQSLLQ